MTESCRLYPADKAFDAQETADQPSKRGTVVMTGRFADGAKRVTIA